MTRHFDVDRLLEDWLTEGPSQLPDRAIDGIVRRLDETPQRKHWWLPGRGNMNRSFFALGGAAAAVVVAVLAVGMYFNQPGVVGPPAATPSPIATASPHSTAEPTPTPEPQAALFTSERYGYTLRLPDDQWRVIERTGEWAPGTTYGQAGRGVDTVLAPITLRYRHDVFLNSQPLDAGTSIEEWLDAYDQLQRSFFTTCNFADDYETSAIGDTEARIDTAVCNGDRWAGAIWLHAGRVYVLRVGEHPDAAVAIDPRQEIETWLDRITLHEPPAAQEFISERYGYTLELPGDQWRVVERPGSWAAGRPYSQEDPGVDVVLGPISQYRHDVFLNSQPLEEGTSFAEWLVAFDQLRWYFPRCTFNDEFEGATVRALTGDRLRLFEPVEVRIGTAVCDGSRWAEALWTHGGRAYSLRIGDHPESAFPIDPRQEIEVWLERITLHRSITRP